MRCPLCGDHALEPRFSHGIEVDVCPNCKGVWLDRGELERIFAAAGPLDEPQQAAHQPTPQSAPPAERSAEPSAPRSSWEPRPADWEADDRHHHRRPEVRTKKKKKKKKGWADLLEDVFDDVLDL
jgi:Zn-finger nucleic acid-binding protein